MRADWAWVHLNAPIVGTAAAAPGRAMLAVSDGGVFNYGTQHFFGSVPGSRPRPEAQRNDRGYRGDALEILPAGADGGVFNYGDAPFLGSIFTAIGNHLLNGPIVGIQHLGELATP